MSLFDKISSLFKGKDVAAPTVQEKSTNTGQPKGDGPFFGDDSIMTQFLLETTMSRARLDMYSQYREMEEQFPEIHSGLDMYADYAVSGGGVEGSPTFEISVKDNEKIQKILDEVESRIQLKSLAWPIVRSMCRDGDVFTELVVDLAGLARVKTLPVKTMYRNEDQFGNLDKYRAFIQKIGYRSIEFEPWQVVHWRLRYELEEMYGRSILFPIRRLSKELQLSEDALTIARLTRAHQRMKWIVDVTGMSEDQQREYLKNYKIETKKARIIDPQTGRLRLRSSPLRAEEDIYVPRTKDGVGDVIPLSGDTSISQIKDIEHKYDRIFTGFKLSKAWFGLTGPNIRSVMGEQGLNFMRTVRRVRAAFKEGALKVYYVGARVRGIPLEELMNTEIDLIFPLMSHTDDELRYRLEQLKLSIVKQYREMTMMSRRDLMIEILKIPEDKVDQILKRAEEDEAPAGSTQTPAQNTVPEALLQQIQDFIQTNEVVSDQVAELRELAQFIWEEKASRGSHAKLSG